MKGPVLAAMIMLGLILLISEPAASAPATFQTFAPNLVGVALLAIVAFVTTREDRDAQ